MVVTETGDLIMIDTPPGRARRERRTAPIHATVRPSTAHAFGLWCDKRGLTVSAAVEALMVDALLRELSTTPVGLLTRDLPPDAYDRIETLLRARITPHEA